MIRPQDVTYSQPLSCLLHVPGDVSTGCNRCPSQRGSNDGARTRADTVTQLLRSGEPHDSPGQTSRQWALAPVPTDKKGNSRDDGSR